jgi:hypothetical protein
MTSDQTHPSFIKNSMLNDQCHGEETRTINMIEKKGMSLWNLVSQRIISQMDFSLRQRCKYICSFLFPQFQQITQLGDT